MGKLDEEKLNHRSENLRRLALALLPFALGVAGYAIYVLLQFDKTHNEVKLHLEDGDSFLQKLERQMLALDKIASSYENSQQRFNSLKDCISQQKKAALPPVEIEKWQAMFIKHQFEQQLELGEVSKYKGEHYPIVAEFASSVAELLANEVKLWKSWQKIMAIPADQKLTPEQEKSSQEFQDNLLQHGSAITGVGGGIEHVKAGLTDAKAKRTKATKEVMGKLDEAKRNSLLYSAALVASILIAGWSILELVWLKEYRKKKRR